MNKTLRYCKNLFIQVIRRLKNQLVANQNLKTMLGSQNCNLEEIKVTLVGLLAVVEKTIWEFAEKLRLYLRE